MNERLMIIYRIFVLFHCCMFNCRFVSICVSVLQLSIYHKDTYMLHKLLYIYIYILLCIIVNNNYCIYHTY